MFGSFAKSRFVGVVLVVGGVGLCLGAIGFVGKTAAFLDAAERGRGRVVEVVEERGVRGTAQRRPVVRFREPGGDSVTFESRFALWPSPFAAGDAVEVAFDPDDPQEAEIHSFWTLWFMPAVMFLFGAACAAAGIITLSSFRKRAT